MTDSDTDPKGTGDRGESCFEQIKVTGDKVISTIRELIQEGGVKHVVVKNDKGDTVIEVPWEFGVVGAVMAPGLTAIGLVAAIMTECTIEVQRSKEPGQQAA